MHTGRTLAFLFLVPLLGACLRPVAPYVAGLEAAPNDPARQAIDRVLDDWHLAASQADGPRYFGHMTGGAVFLGTDPTERWPMPEFRAFAEPIFATGRGWTYQSQERHVYLSEDRDVAWFDDRLWNDKYGECRGTGTLVLEQGVWRIAHYNLVFPIPNDMAGEITERIREEAFGR